ELAAARAIGEDQAEREHDEERQQSQGHAGDEERRPELRVWGPRGGRRRRSELCDRCHLLCPLQWWWHRGHPAGSIPVVAGLGRRLLPDDEVADSAEHERAREEVVERLLARRDARHQI